MSEEEELAVEALQNLAANMLRVIRGAGEPYRLVDQMVVCLERLVAAHTTPMSVLTDEAFRNWRKNPAAESNEFELARIRNNIIAGALKVTAERIGGTKVQEVRGESEMWQGLNELEQWLARKRRARWKQ